MNMKPWVEVHRPTSLNDVIFPSQRMQNAFQQYVKTGDLPNLLLYGGPGTGKTSISGALLRDLDIDPMDRLRINCSDEKIDAMRDKVRAFANKVPIGRYHTDDPRPEFNVVQLEEFDYLSQDAQALLRSLIEETSRSCRFIATCNYVHRIIPPLRSRFQEWEIATPDLGAVEERAISILEHHKIKYDTDTLHAVVAAGYPDFRKIINLLQQHSSSGTLIVSDVEKAQDWKLGLLPLLAKGDFKAARKLVCDSATKEELVEVYRFLYEHTADMKKLKGKEDQAVVLIAQYQYQHSFVADPEIQIAALFIELGTL
jgi:DNA polymerase III delta prime subunit